MQILDGKKVAAKIKEDIKAEVDAIKAAGKRTPHLVAILVGHDGASETYVASKAKDCEQLGMSSTVIRFEDTVTEDELLAEVERINNDPQYDGLIVQMPLPKHINPLKVTETISPKKDVDGFHPYNVGLMFKGLDAFYPATPYGVLLMLEEYKIPTEGKHCVIIGRSDIVGKPMSALMARAAYPGNCTVTVCHSKTQNIEEYTRKADILIVALGRPEFVKADMVKPGAVVVDVGITRVDDATNPRGYVIKGDVAFDEVAPVSSYITPVPGGVGLMTRIGLLKNTLHAYKLKMSAYNELVADPRFWEFAELVFKGAEGDFDNFAHEMINTLGKGVGEYLPEFYSKVGGDEEITFNFNDIKVIDGKLMIPEKLIRRLVLIGFDKIDRLVDKIYFHIFKNLPSVTKNDIRDEIVKYGKSLDND